MSSARTSSDFFKDFEMDPPKGSPSCSRSSNWVPVISTASGPDWHSTQVDLRKKRDAEIQLQAEKGKDVSLEVNRLLNLRVGLICEWEQYTASSAFEQTRAFSVEEEIRKIELELEKNGNAVVPFKKSRGQFIPQITLSIASSVKSLLSRNFGAQIDSSKLELCEFQLQERSPGFAVSSIQRTVFSSADSGVIPPPFGMSFVFSSFLNHFAKKELFWKSVFIVFQISFFNLVFLCRIAWCKNLIEKHQLCFLCRFYLILFYFFT